MKSSMFVFTLMMIVGFVTAQAYNKDDQDLAVAQDSPELMMPLEKRSPSAKWMRFGKRSPSAKWMRFGKRSPSAKWMRFGKRGDTVDSDY